MAANTNNLPADTFDGESIHLTTSAAAVKAISDKSDKMLRVEVGKLAPLPGFNLRVKNDAYRQRVSDIANSMVANGYYAHKPLAGLLLDGQPDKVFIYDGEHRLDAIPLAIERGAAIKDVPVVIAPAGTTVEDLTVTLFQANTGEKLSPVEMAAGIKRMLSFGWDKEQVSKRISMTVRHIDNLLVLGGATTAVRNAVADGKIAAAEAVKLVRKDPKTAAQKVKDAIAAAEAKGKAKATPRTMKAATGPKMVRERVEFSVGTGGKMGNSIKEVAKAIRRMIAHKTDDSDLVQEDGKIILMVETLDKTPAKPAAAPKPAKAPKAAVDPDAALAAAPAAKKGAAKAKASTAKAAAAPRAAKPSARAATAKTPAADAAPAPTSGTDAAESTGNDVDASLAHAGLEPAHEGAAVETAGTAEGGDFGGL